MDIVSVVIIAIGLSMDSFAVSITNGLTIRNLNFRKVLIITLSLALFQALMPLLGWFVGSGAEKYITEFDHWIAFLLLSVIGLKMIIEGIKKNGDSEKSDFKIPILIGQSIATSIDAFAIGISFAILSSSILIPILIIGVVTFIFSLLGISLGKFFGNKFGKSVEIFGGLVLLSIGIKILIEHIYL